MAGLCVVRATSNAYPTHSPGHHSQYQLAINLWDKLTKFCRLNRFIEIFRAELFTRVYDSRAKRSVVHHGVTNVSIDLYGINE